MRAPASSTTPVGITSTPCGRPSVAEATERNGMVVAVRAVTEEEGVVFVTRDGLLVRTPAAQISKIGRNTQGVRVVNLKEGDRLIGAAVTPASEAGGEDDEIGEGDEIGES